LVCYFWLNANEWSNNFNGAPRNALRWNNFRYKSLMGWTHARTTFTSVKDGGSQIDFEDEEPAIHLEFIDALTKAGAECKMCDYYPQCPKKMAAE